MVVYMVPHAEFGQNDHREGATHFISRFYYKNYKFGVNLTWMISQELANSPYLTSNVTLVSSRIND